MGEFTGLVALVTGGASGIGAETVAVLRERGARVVALDLVPEAAPEGCSSVRCDVGDDESVRAAIGEVGARFGRIDIVVNNAGISAVGTIEDNPDEEWQRVLGINVQGIVRVTRAALPYLRESEHAAVVNLCSMAALNGLPQRALYSASKGAVMSLTFAMATDHIGEEIRVNCVSPGTVHTPFVDRMLAGFDDPGAEKEALDARQATGRMVQPREVAEAIAFLASPRSGSIVGTALEIDAGATHLRPRKVNALRH